MQRERAAASLPFRHQHVAVFSRQDVDGRAIHVWKGDALHAAREQPDRRSPSAHRARTRRYPRPELTPAHVGSQREQSSCGKDRQQPRAPQAEKRQAKHRDRRECHTQPGGVGHEENSAARKIRSPM